MDRGRYLRCHLLLVSQPAVQCSNHFMTEFCQFYVSESRKNVVSNQRHMIGGICGIGPMNPSIKLYILLKELHQIVGIAL